MRPSEPPWRSGQPGRPALPLPPAPMPGRRGMRPLKRWRWVGAFDAAVMVCVATVRIGPLPVSWWAVWDREAGVLTERTVRRRDAVVLRAGCVRLDAGDVSVDLRLHESNGVETVSPHGAAYAWTRKQAGIPVSGTVVAGGRRHALRDARAVVDDSAGYHARRTAWRWSAGVGAGPAGEAVGWNLCAGLHDDPRASENTVWVDGTSHPLGPARFDDLRAVTVPDGRLVFSPEAARAHREDRLVVASDYEAPFGTFSGELPGVGAVTGLGVMERHAARW